jgi:superfamily II DNA or RNA helicase
MRRMLFHIKRSYWVVSSKPLPGLTEKDIRLVMLKLPYDAPQPTTSNGETLLSIIENDMQNNVKHIAVMVGRSGCGKTATIVRLARKHFVIYMCCENPLIGLPPLEFPDPNFRQMVMELQKSVIQSIPVPKDIAEFLQRDQDAKRIAREHVELEILARLLFLRGLFEIEPNLTPEQFFIEQQTETGGDMIEELVDKCRAYESSTISRMIEEVKKQLAPLIKDKSVVIAADEAQLADTIMRQMLISPTALASQNTVINQFHS